MTITEGLLACSTVTLVILLASFVWIATADKRKWK